MAVYYLVDRYDFTGGVHRIGKLEAIADGLYMPYSDLQIKTRKVGDLGTMADFKRFANANKCDILTETEFEWYLCKLPVSLQDKHRAFINSMLNR